MNLRNTACWLAIAGATLLGSHIPPQRAVAANVARKPSIVAVAPATTYAPSEPVNLAYSWAWYYGIPAQWFVNTLACESGFDTRAIGRHGEQGAAQWMPYGGLWSWYTPEGRAGLQPFDVSVSRQIQLAAQAFSEGYANEWLCAR